MRISVAVKPDCSFRYRTTKRDFFHVYIYFLDLSQMRCQSSRKTANKNSIETFFLQFLRKFTGKHTAVFLFCRYRVLLGPLIECVLRFSEANFHCLGFIITKSTQRRILGLLYGVFFKIHFILIIFERFSTSPTNQQLDPYFH